MAMNRVQFQAAMSWTRFRELYGTEEHEEGALEQTRRPDGFRCSRCGERSWLPHQATDCVKPRIAIKRTAKPLEVAEKAEWAILDSNQ